MTLLEALLALRGGELHYPSSGICPNLEFLIEIDDEILRELMSGWPKHSGDMYYPVPGGRDAYYESMNKWEGEYGALRRELLDYMIEQL